MDESSDEALAAQHEAGHAVAFLRRGFQIREIFLDPYDGFTQEDLDDGIDDRDPNFPFILYAGPWAHALAGWGDDDPLALDAMSLDGKRFGDLVDLHMQSNLSDWKRYERAMGGDLDAIDKFVRDQHHAFEEGLPQSGVVRPPVTSPRGDWHSELLTMRHEIESLTSLLLSSDGKPVQVGANTLNPFPSRASRWLKLGTIPSS